ncbi:Transmembrane protein 234 [Strongyloides ratti]|uniref:Transmembrane protein 234 n=1 Tax=Strongyloides ratti TaxID=34506 RepID=A0A090MX24_STRRB|nr:Transmembrane protein 234 [Strongyloides ratti]CEF64689.1 Transmembrane protein 234 [Strongyloides ratti]
MFALKNLFYIVIVSFIWGTSNPFIRKGALHRRCNSIKLSREEERNVFLRYAVDGINFILNWRFSLPFMINQLGSILYNILLTSMPVTIVVPVVNSLTFFWTAFVGGYVDGTKLTYKQWIGVLVLFLGNFIITCIERNKI